MNIGEIIKNRRKELGMSAEDVAEIIGTSPATIYRYESNYITKMGVDKLTPIAKALRVSEAYLMGWTTDPNWRPESDVSLSSSSADPLQLTEQEEELLNGFRSLSDEQKIRVIAYLEGTLDSSGNLGAMLRSEADKIVNKEKGKAAMSAKKVEVF